MRYLQRGRLPAIPLLFVTLLLILAACGNGGGGTIPTTTGVPKLAARQILTFPNVGVADSASLDPALVTEASDPNTSLIVSMIYTGLVKSDINLNVLPDQATWEISSDGKVSPRTCCA